MLDFYFVTRGDIESESGLVYKQFSSLYNWIKAELKQHQSIDKDGLLGS